MVSVWYHYGITIFSGKLYITHFLLIFSSTNAYMLMYRKKDRSQNAMFMDPKKWPDHIKRLSEKLEEDEEDEIDQRARDKNMCKVGDVFR